MSPDPNSLTPPPANRTKGPGRCDLRKSLDRFGALVDKVDFPKFAGDLIKDVLEPKPRAFSKQKPRLTGELRVNFESDFLPLDPRSNPPCLNANNRDGLPGEQ